MHDFLRLSATLLLSTCAVSCGGATQSTTPGGGTDATQRVESVSADTLALLEAAGGNAAATVVFYPRHWSTMSATLLRIGGELLPDEVRTILSASAPWPAARAVAAEERVTLPRTLEGWDDSRPLVFALFEPPDFSVAELLARTEERNPSDELSHRVVIPSSDPAALTRALVEIARSLECVDTPEPLARDLPDTPSVVCKGNLGVIEPGDGWVRVRVVRLRDATLPAAITREASAPTVVTPALRWTFEGPVVLAAHIRPEKLRAALLTFMAEDAGRMAGYSDGDTEHERRVVRAKAKVLGAILRTSPVGAEVDDVALGLVTGNLPTFTLVQGLTDVGVSAYEAGTDAPVPAEGPADAPLVVRSRINVDVMQAVAGVPMGLGGAGDPNAALERMSDCGEPCYLHMVASRVFGLGALSDQTGLLREIEEEAGAFFRFQPAELEGGATMEISLDFPLLAQRLGGDRMVTQLAAAVGVARAVQVRHERTVMTTARLGEVPPPPNPAHFAEGDPGALGPASRRDEAAACAEAVLVGFENASGRGRRQPASNACAGAPEELRALIDAWQELSR